MQRDNNRLHRKAKTSTNHDALALAERLLACPSVTPAVGDVFAELEAMLQKILSIGKKCGTPVGIHVQTIEACQKRIAEGWQFMALGSELRFMVTEAQKMVQGMNLKQSSDLARY